MLAVMGEHFKGRPRRPDGLIAELIAQLTDEEAPFKAHLDAVILEWLPPDSDRLGNTHFDMSRTELEVRRKHRMPPGQVTIGLHPRLAEDEALYTHTLAHELLHAAGLTDHDPRHASLVNLIAPAPTLAESEVLRSLRDQALASQEQQDWTCDHCGFIWVRKTVRAPSRCPKCARPFK